MSYFFTESVVTIATENGHPESPPPQRSVPGSVVMLILSAAQDVRAVELAWDLVAARAHEQPGRAQ